MEQNQNHLPEAATDEPAFPLTENAFVSGLVSDELTERFAHAAAAAEPPPSGRAVRHDGWTPERIRAFLVTLAQCGVVADAARAVGISSQSVYRFRNRADGRAFHLAMMAAANHHGRRRLSDETTSRAMNGCIETIRKDGVVVAERHRYDNRLAMAVLTRLDKQAESIADENVTARLVAQEFDQFVDIVCEGDGEKAAEFIERRRKLESKPVLSREAELLDRLENYKLWKAGLLHEIDTSDLEPARMEEWTEEQAERADLSGLLDRLALGQWPESIREGEDEKVRGNSHLHHLHLIYRGLAAERTKVEEPAREAGRVWKDEDGWWTDFPPHDGFDGEEEGEYGEEDYRRALSPEEQAVIDAELAETAAEERVREEAERDRFFGGAG